MDLQYTLQISFIDSTIQVRAKQTAPSFNSLLINNEYQITWVNWEYSKTKGSLSNDVFKAFDLFIKAYSNCILYRKE